MRRILEILGKGLFKVFIKVGRVAVKSFSAPTATFLTIGLI